MDDEQSIPEDAEQHVIGEYGQPRTHCPRPGTVVDHEEETSELLDIESGR